MKLHTDVVREIKAYLNQGYRVNEIAVAYGVSRSAVSAIRNERSHQAVMPATRDQPPLRRVKRDRDEIHPDGSTDRDRQERDAERMRAAREERQRQERERQTAEARAKEQAKALRVVHLLKFQDDDRAGTMCGEIGAAGMSGRWYLEAQALVEYEGRRRRSDRDDFTVCTECLASSKSAIKAAEEQAAEEQAAAEVDAATEAEADVEVQAEVDAAAKAEAEAKALELDSRRRDGLLRGEIRPANAIESAFIWKYSSENPNREVRPDAAWG